MRDSPKISVVIPTFNRSKTIRYCLDSVLNQTYPPYEIIVVDDCSTDNTLEIVKSYGNEKIKYLVLQEKSGPQVARNVGIKNAKSDWIAFQDSDDEWLPNKLEKQIKELGKSEHNLFTVIHTNCYRFYPEIKKKSCGNYPH